MHFELQYHWVNPEHLIKSKNNEITSNKLNTLFVTNMGDQEKLNASELIWTIDQTWRPAISARFQCWNESASSQLLDCVRVPLYPTEKASLTLQKLTSFPLKWIHRADETGSCSSPNTQTICVDRCNIYTIFCLLFSISLQPSITGGQAVRWWFQFCNFNAETKDATSKTSLHLKLTYTQVMSRKETQTKHGWWQIQEDDIFRGQAKHQTFLHWNVCLLLDCMRVPSLAVLLVHLEPLNIKRYSTCCEITLFISVMQCATVLGHSKPDLIICSKLSFQQRKTQTVQERNQSRYRKKS